MKIVILDGYTLNPGDLSWEALKQFGDLEIFDRTPEPEVVRRCAGADIVFTNKTPLRQETLQQLASLRYIGVLATGYNVVDTDFAKSRGILVSNVPGYSTSSVVQHTFALLLELCHHIQKHSDSVMRGEWSSSADFSYTLAPLMELDGKTLGIVGFGSIGQLVAEVAAAFGMKVLGTSRTHTDQSHRSYFRWVDFPELLRSSDVISLHCPLTPDTAGLINKNTLMQMKKSAFLLNTSRGPVVVEQDLAEALNAGVIAGAALDVLSSEPPLADNPLLKAKNCIITPHIAWATKEARARMMGLVEQNLRSFLEGSPLNIVNK